MEFRVAIYLRVSTDQQSHDSQRRELEQYCRHRKWMHILSFSDVGSGAKQSRDGLSRLMEKVRQGKIDIVVAYKIDRLARSLNHLAQIIAELQTHNVALVCPGQGIDTTNANPCAQFQLNILAAVAQFERELITERVNAGISAAKQRGVKLGRPSKADKYLDEVDTLVAQGHNAAEISRALKIPYSTASEIVRTVRLPGFAHRG